MPSTRSETGDTEPSPITLAQINEAVAKAIAKAIKELDKTNKDRHTEVMDSLNSKCQALETRVDALAADVSNKDEIIKSLTADNARQAALIAAIDKRLAHLKDITYYNILQTNERHQRQRNWGCRFTNVYFGGQKITAMLIYSKLVAPALQLAVDAGELDSVPSFRQCFDHEHFLFKPRDSRAETWLFRFTTRFLLYKFLKFKKIPLNQVNEDNGAKSYADATRRQRLSLTRCGQDMTPFNRALISTLISMKEVGLARISGTGVVVAKKADMSPEPRSSDTKLKWFPVVNPFGRDLTEMLTVQPTLASLMTKMYDEDSLPPYLIKPAASIIDSDEDVEPNK
jgi:hypothetical protein